MLSRSLKSEALNAEETALARYVDGVVHPLPELFGTDPMADELVSA
jgi:hypothetical protein